ncbi:hypothetical protein [Nocardioides sp. URHA0020]|uniref:hypothetical protein n=1 Tax=Nocardioides sp. URHA0020 TaxID=1380392 RepID=UPI000560D415|nr:hypothetical protein [Nocardioides sp. URHA0020]
MSSVEFNQELHEDLLQLLTALDSAIRSSAEGDLPIVPEGARVQLGNSVALAQKLLSSTIDRDGEDVLLWHTEPACLVPTHPDIDSFARAASSGGLVNETQALRADYLLSQWTRDVLNSLQSGLSDTSVFDPARLELAGLRQQVDALVAAHSAAWTSNVTSENQGFESTWRTLIDASKYLVRTGGGNGEWPLVRAAQLVLGAVIGEAGDVVLVRVFTEEQLAQLASLLSRVMQDATVDRPVVRTGLDEWLDGAMAFARGAVARRRGDKRPRKLALHDDLARLEFRVQSLRSEARQLGSAVAITEFERSAERSAEMALRAAGIAREAASGAGTGQLAEWFDKFATSRRHGSWLWFAIAASVIAATVAALVFHHPDEPDWQQALSSVAYSLPLFALAAFAAKESSRARTTQLWAASLTVQLRTLEAYAEILEPSSRAELYARFSEHVFTPLAPAGQLNELKAVPSEVVRLLEVLAAGATRTPRAD